MHHGVVRPDRAVGLVDNLDPCPCCGQHVIADDDGDCDNGCGNEVCTPCLSVCAGLCPDCYTEECRVLGITPARATVIHGPPPPPPPPPPQPRCDKCGQGHDNAGKRVCRDCELCMLSATHDAVHGTRPIAAALRRQHARAHPPVPTDDERRAAEAAEKEQRRRVDADARLQEGFENLELADVRQRREAVEVQEQREEQDFIAASEQQQLEKEQQQLEAKRRRLETDKQRVAKSAEQERWELEAKRRRVEAEEQKLAEKQRRAGDTIKQERQLLEEERRRVEAKRRRVENEQQKLAEQQRRADEAAEQQRQQIDEKRRRVENEQQQLEAKQAEQQRVEAKQAEKQRQADEAAVAEGQKPSQQEEPGTSPLRLSDEDDIFGQSLPEINDYCEVEANRRGSPGMMHLLNSLEVHLPEKCTEPTCARKPWGKVTAKTWGAYAKTGPNARVGHYHCPHAGCPYAFTTSPVKHTSAFQKREGKSMQAEHVQKCKHNLWRPVVTGAGRGGNHR